MAAASLQPSFFFYLSTMQEIWEKLLLTSWLEAIAMVSGLLFPIFASFEKKICWLFGGISALTYAWVMFDEQLYQDGVLSIFYIVMSIYGYLMWQGVIKPKKDPVKISHASPFTVFIYITISLQYFFIGGYCFDNFTDADYPYVDAFVTGFSLVATWLEAKKKIDNWYLFLVADSVGVWLFWQKGLILTSILYIIYCIICVYGIIQWKKKIKLLKLQ